MLITSWAVLGLLSGGLLGVLARRLLRTTWFGRRVWIASAALTGVLFALLAWRLGQTFSLLPYSYLAAVLVPLTVVDLAERRLPNVVVLPSYFVLGAAFGVNAVFESSHGDLVRSLAGMVVLAAAYFALAMATDGLGAGDVKLAGLLGLALGWWSWTALLTGTFLGWLAASVAWISLRFADELAPKTPCP